jgi:antitoxin VapB
MALNIKDPETEQLAARLAALTDETKTRAVKIALQERMERLTAGVPRQREPGASLRRFLTDEAWPQVPAEVLGAPLSRSEREQILGYGPDGV